MDQVPEEYDNNPVYGSGDNGMDYWDNWPG